MNTETHIELHGKCLSTAYRENILYQPNKPITIKHPLKKGSKNLPAWFEISEESLKELKAAENKLAEAKAAENKLAEAKAAENKLAEAKAAENKLAEAKASKASKATKEVKSENSLV